MIRLKYILHAPSKSPFFVQNGFNSVPCCLHIMLERSKVPLTQTVTLMVCVNEPISCSIMFTMGKVMAKLKKCLMLSDGNE